MSEYDLVMMSLVIGLPTLFALVLLAFPARAVECMRWWALLGAATTMVLSCCMLIEYYGLLDSRSDRGLRTLHHPQTLLTARADEATERANLPVPKPRQSYDWVARLPWIERFDIQYAVGVDGINMPLILLTSIVTFFALLASWKIDTHVKAYLALVLVLETGVLGAFLALDFFLFYVFYEVMLLPMYFLIGIWGGGRRKFAAMKFVVYTLLGSVLILMAMIGLYFTDVRDFADQNTVNARAAERLRTNPRIDPDEARAFHTFDIVTLQKAGQAAMLVLSGHADRLRAVDAPEAPNSVPLLAKGVRLADAQARFQQPFFTSTWQFVFFGLLFVGFAVKIPLVPLHSWLPDAHVEAPTPISMILAGILLKLGGYGLIRFAVPICPYAADQLSLYTGMLGAFAIVYGALVAMGQTDFKKLLAYSSISHMGYVVLGLSAWSDTAGATYWAWAMNGAMFQMVAHGITATALFFVVGVIYDRAHHREISRFGGLLEPMPLYSGMAAVLFFASMGLPGLCGFVGEVFVVLGTWHAQPYLAIPAILATVLTAGYLLWTWQRVYLGTSPTTGNYPDVTLREMLVLLPFVLLAILLGILPTPLLLSWMEPSVTGLTDALARLK